MGQRSQIYCRITGMDGSVHLIANYYPWNFGERMISRAAATLTYCFTDPNLTEIMNGNEYLKDDLGINWRKPKYIYQESPIEERKEMIKEQEELVAYTEKNLETLEQFDLMTEEELEKFLSMDYERVLPEFRNNDKEPMLER